MFWSILGDCLRDTLLILPLLFLTYLLMEYVEHRAGEKMERAIGRSGRLGPIWGAALGLIPQCGFSGAAAGLYAGRVITLGTLAAVFLATSDEMLPVLLGAGVPLTVILKVLGLKLLIGMAVGFLTDALRPGSRLPARERIAHLCRDEDCGCHRHGIFRAAALHTLKIILFIFLVSLALQLLLAYSGMEDLAGAALSRPVLGVLIALGLGLIPNCSASVLITQLYAEGLFSAGALLAGLLLNAGVGLLVLFRTNRHMRENLLFTAWLAGISLGFGLLLELLGLTL